MKLKIEVPQFSPEKGIEYRWEFGFSIEVKTVNNSVCISANREGLISLANHLLNLAQEKVPQGHHLHFDEYNSLEEGSLQMIIEKI
jgi:hypothetical protein